MKKLFLLTVLSFFLSCNNEKETSNALKSDAINKVSNTSLQRVEPPHWWIGFKNNTLQLLVKEDGIATASPEISYQGVSIKKVTKGKSPNYLFIDLIISDKTDAGKFDIVFKFENGNEKAHTYELKSREKSPEDYIGFNSSDVVLLITPDRFANGNASNDSPSSMEGQPILLEKTINRNEDYARHGGDIQGMIDHLDYISDMGFTAIWTNPLLINDMPKWSYHGYAITDLYQIDPRFGTLEDYKQLSQKAKDKGIKLIMDQVANHCGVEHWWMKDLPFSDWLNHQEDYEKNVDKWEWDLATYSNHKRTSNQDIYASKVDTDGNRDGWFTHQMPDLNQRNPFMAKYIIQNSIWWIETAGLSGIRQDTYPYPDKAFMSNWAGAIMTEYPNFNIVGEEWSYNPLLIGYWQDGANNKDGYDSNLKSTMDFAMQKNIIDALNQEESWDKGLIKMYEGLANDFHYASPKDIMIFADNHDMSRIFTQLKGDAVNTKMALSYLLMLPRTPQIYYGTEILMDDFDNPGDHGLIRTDFPGGWQGDAINAFTGKGLTDAQKEMQMYLKTVLNFRKSSKAVHEGKTIHFAPLEGTYFMFRLLDNETVVHIINKNNSPIEIDLKRYTEIDLEGKTLKNIVTGASFVWKDTIKINEKGSIILTTKIK